MPAVRTNHLELSLLFVNICSRVRCVVMYLRRLWRDVFLPFGNKGIQLNCIFAW